jgi:BirA family biotin operon repressor/biotin-[acetyl-CoA-carboxylase] ligase
VLQLGPQSQRAGIGLRTFDAVGSTNAEALTLARAGERGPLWVATTEQTAGRGRRGRTWISPRGNLAASIVEVLTIQPGTAATLGFAAGIAVHLALTELAGPALDLRLKWPNDVLVQGRKLCGILLEAEVVPAGLAVVVGMGVNIVGAPPASHIVSAALRDLGVTADAGEVFAALTDAWQICRICWDEGRGFEEIRRLWLERAAGLGEPVTVVSGASTIEGVFETIDDSGCLVIATAVGRQTISAGDVFFGGAASAQASA